MAINTNLSVSPYFDDFDENKGFYKILFKPGVSVQVRELNQLQTILQNQIEKFGSNIFKSGSIISGVNFTFNDKYHFVRISDTDINGVPTIPLEYVGMFVESANSGVRAQIIEALDGSQLSEAGDTKTLYINYVNGGNDNSTTEFKSGETLVITNANNSLFSVDVVNGGRAFSNSDTVVFTSALVVAPESNTGSFFSVGNIITQPVTTTKSYESRAIITSISNTYFDDGRLVISIKPRDEDLTNNPNNIEYWKFENGTRITNATNTAIANVQSSIGRNAVGQVITDAIGFVDAIVITNIGYGYSVTPHVSVKPIDPAADVVSFSAIARNYRAKIKVPTAIDPSGVGYAMSVTEGYIYQKGYFLKVQPQSVVVSKYNNQPDNVSVVFDTKESIVSSNIDSSLFDNVLGTSNSKAPGADRLKLAPELTIIATSLANESDYYYSLVDFSEGKPFKQNRYTAYNEINNEMARRTMDESGDYVINEFLATTRSPLPSAANTTSPEASLITYVVDPGKAYISGNRVETVENHYEDVDAGIDIKTTNNAIISLNYGNYVRVKEVGGVFPFNYGDLVTFFPVAYSYITSKLTTIPSALSNAVATARIRSFVLEGGTPGTNTAVYRLYLFDLRTATAKKFTDARSVYYNKVGVGSGIADLVLEQDPVTAANVAVVQSPNNSVLLWKATPSTLQNIANVSYTYRTVNNSVVFANTGLATISYSTVPNEFFPYMGNLTSSQMFDLNIVPQSNIILSTALSGSITTSYTSNAIIGTSFAANFKVGDYVYVEANTTSIVIDSQLNVDSAADRILYASNPFANGDNVTYTVATGNTAIAGIADAGVYYVYNANSSGFQLVSSPGNTAPIGLTAAGVGEVGHSFSTDTVHYAYRQVVNVANNTSMQLNANLGFTSTDARAYRYFPQNLPLPYGTRQSLTANVDSNQNILSLNLGGSFRGSSSANVVATYNIVRRNVTPATKVAKRNIPVAIQISTNPGGLKGPWCLGCPDIFRLNYVTIGGVDYTDKFYIDHNQNADYLDLGYLYLNPSVNSSFITLSSILEVGFDAYVVSGDKGFYASPSYVSANSIQQFTDDSLELINLNTKTNTHEVPELNTNKNDYYDLLTAVDFRPIALPTISVDAGSSGYVGNTINYDFGSGPISSTATIRNTNPLSTLIFAANGSTTDLKFPLPDSVVTANVSYYVPRIDSVIATKSGRITSIKGAPAIEPKAPTKPSDSLLIDNILVPAYPTVPKNPDTRTLNILNKRMASERYTVKRLKDKTAKNLLPVNDIKTTQQPKGYSMADIGNLERRIKDLEYYVGLNQLESTVSSLVIPSSINGSIDRFKYGFFVDDFSSIKFSDRDNPEYKASIAFNDLYPLAENINLLHNGSPFGGDGNSSKLNWSLEPAAEITVSRQDVATYLALPKPCVLESGTPVAVVELTRQQANPYVADNAVDSYQALSFSEFTNPATLYFFTYNQPVKIEIIQNGIPIKSTINAEPLTSDDITYMKKLSYFNNSEVVLTTAAPTVAGGFATGCGKIKWNHVASSGRNYIIKTTKGTNSKKWRWLLEYPINSSDYIDCVIDVGPAQPTTTTTTTSTTTTTTTSTTTTTTTSTTKTTTTTTSTSTSSSTSTSTSTTTSTTKTTTSTSTSTATTLTTSTSSSTTSTSTSTSTTTSTSSTTTSTSTTSTSTATATTTTSTSTSTSTTTSTSTSTTTSTSSTTTSTTTTTTTTGLPENGLYLQQVNRTYSGDGMALLNDLAWDPTGEVSGPKTSAGPGSVNVSSWNALKTTYSNNPYVLNSTTDKFKVVYITPQTMSNMIRRHLYNYTGVNHAGVTPGLVTAVSNLYFSIIKRPPEIGGLYGWIWGLVLGNWTFAQVEASFNETRTSWQSTWGTPAWRWDTYGQIANINPGSVPGTGVLVNHLEFVRPNNMYKIGSNYLTENELSLESGAVGRYTYYIPNYDINKSARTPVPQMWQASYENIRRGVSKEIGINIPDDIMMKKVHGWYWKYLARPPEWKGFVGWLSNYYKGVESEQSIENNIYISTEAIARRAAGSPPSGWSSSYPTDLMAISSNINTANYAPYAPKIETTTVSPAGDSTGSLVDGSSGIQSSGPDGMGGGSDSTAG